MDQSESQKKFLPLLYLWIAMLIFSSANPVVSKLGHLGASHLVEGRNPISFCNVLFAANFIAGIVLLGINRASWRKESLQTVSKRDWMRMLFLAIVSGVVGPTLFFIGLMLTEVINVILISTIDIPFTLLFAWLLLREKPTKGGLFSSFFSITGILVIFFLAQSAMPMEMKMKMANLGDGPLARFLAGLPFAGEICIAFATLFTVFSVEYSKKATSSVPIGIFSVFRMIMGASIFFTIAMIIFGPEHFVDLLDPFLIKWMLFYGGVIIALGLFIWYKGISDTSSSDLAVTNSFQPIAGVVFAYLILGQVPSSAQLVGGIIIMLGVAIALFDMLKVGKQRKLNEFSKPRCFTGV